MGLESAARRMKRNLEQFWTPDSLGPDLATGPGTKSVLEKLEKAAMLSTFRPRTAVAGPVETIGPTSKPACKKGPTLNNPQIQFPSILDRVRGSGMFTCFQKAAGLI